MRQPISTDGHDRYPAAVQNYRRRLVAIRHLLVESRSADAVELIDAQIAALNQPEGWGFCGNRTCECWRNDGPACEEYVDDLGDPHPYLRCHRCGRVEDDHQ